MRPTQEPFVERMGCMGENVISEESQPLLMLFPLLHRLMNGIMPHGCTPLTRTQAYIVCVMSSCSELTMSELANYVGISKEQATRAIDPMVNTGLAERFADARNRKLVYIRLTESGREKVREFRQAFTARLTEYLNEDELESLREAMFKSVVLLKKCK